MRLKLRIEYAGTRYSGWQIQKNARTVQGEIEAAIAQAAGTRDFELYGSGRTDAGVHALGQVAHLELPGARVPDDLVDRINAKLPSDINVLSAAKVPHRFHARHDAVARSYLYQIARRRTAFAKPYVWWVKEDLDLARMAEGARRFTGRHDFRSFSDARAEEGSTLVEIEDVRVEEVGALVLVRVEGSHFLWKMVRRMIGVLVEAGRGGMAADNVSRLFESRSPVPARLTAPASGLFLERVLYPGDRRDYPLVAPLFFL